MTYPLHYDHLAKHFPERVRDVEAAIKADVLSRGIERLSSELMAAGLFPAEAVSLVVRANHQLQGRQTFEVGPVLSELLEHTELSNITPDELRFPYTTFYVHLPASHLHIWGGERTRWHPLAGFYCHLEEGCLSLLLWGAENECSLGPGDDATQWGVLPLTPGTDLEALICRLVNPKNRRDDPMIDPLFYLIEGSHEDGLEGAAFERQMDALRSCFRIAVNLALYLASDDKADVAEVPDKGLAKLRAKAAKAKGAKRRRFEEQLAKRTVIRRVGASVEAAVRGQREAHGPVRGTWVRGHWRSYWTGAGRTTKVRRWILPHPRGLTQPDRRTYEVAALRAGGEQ